MEIFKTNFNACVFLDLHLSLAYQSVQNIWSQFNLNVDRNFKEKINW